MNNIAAQPKNLGLIFLLLGFGIFFSACGSGDKPPIKTVETESAQRAIDGYESKPTDEAKVKVEQAFNELDGEIKELEVRVEKVTGDTRAEANKKLSDLKARKNELRMDFTEAKFKALADDIKNSVR